MTAKQTWIDENEIVRQGVVKQTLKKHIGSGNVSKRALSWIVKIVTVLAQSMAKEVAHSMQSDENKDKHKQITKRDVLQAYYKVMRKVDGTNLKDSTSLCVGRVGPCAELLEPGVWEWYWNRLSEAIKTNKKRRPSGGNRKKRSVSSKKNTPPPTQEAGKEGDDVITTPAQTQQAEPSVVVAVDDPQQ